MVRPNMLAYLLPKQLVASRKLTKVYILVVLLLSPQSATKVDKRRRTANARAKKCEGILSCAFAYCANMFFFSVNVTKNDPRPRVPNSHVPESHVSESSSFTSPSPTSYVPVPLLVPAVKSDLKLGGKDRTGDNLTDWVQFEFIFRRNRF